MIRITITLDSILEKTNRHAWDINFSSLGTAVGYMHPGLPDTPRIKDMDSPLKCLLHDISHMGGVGSKYFRLWTAFKVKGEGQMSPESQHLYDPP